MRFTAFYWWVSALLSRKGSSSSRDRFTIKLYRLGLPCRVVGFKIKRLYKDVIDHWVDEGVYFIAGALVWVYDLTNF